MCTLALKTRNVDEAIDYYDEFIQIAPKDPNQHILKYQILRAQRAPIEQQIHALEEFKKAEYIEEWAYELAKLYQEAGMTAECLDVYKRQENVNLLRRGLRLHLSSGKIK